MKPMGIIELLQRIGEEKVLIQNLLNDMTNITAGKRETKITFATNQLTPGEVAFGVPKMHALVIWMPTDEVDRARREHRDAETERAT